VDAPRHALFTTLNLLGHEICGVGERGTIRAESAAPATRSASWSWRLFSW